MPIEKIEVVCPICNKCNKAVQHINYALKTLNAKAPIIRVPNLDMIPKTSVGTQQTPVILINGKVEFAGVVPEIPLLKIRLKELIYT
jgi:glutaredoxin